MSRIGKLPIKLPQGVSITVNKNNEVTVKGPLGELHQKVHNVIKIDVNENIVQLSCNSNEKPDRCKYGLYRALINNMVTGVSKGYTIEMEVVGVGYKATNKGQLLELSLGHSHDIVMELPSEIKLETRQERRSNPIITLKSIDKQLIGQVAAKIRSLRKPEPYKGKGIKYVNEILRRKAGKTVASSSAS